MSGNDLLGTADNVQAKTESMFGGKFETVVSMDDFAMKHHFKGNLNIHLTHDTFQRAKHAKLRRADRSLPVSNLTK